MPLSPANAWKQPVVNLIIMHCEYQHTLVITITVHQFTIHANAMVGEFHFMMQMQPINTGILLDQRLFFLFSEGKNPYFACPAPQLEQIRLTPPVQVSSCAFTLGESLAKIKRRDINSLCSQSRTLCTSRMVKGELSIKPTGRQQRIWGLCMYMLRNQKEKSIH